MTLTVDLVIAGDSRTGRAAAVSALQRGQRVLVVLRAGPRVGRRFRRYLCRAAPSAADRLSVMTSAEVVCADGVDAVEAVVVRHTRTGRLSAVNASAFASFDDSIGRRFV